jgi:hypothetical protein
MRIRQLSARLRDEQGIALVMAIGIAMVLAIAGTSLIAYGTSNERAATRSKQAHDAYQLSVSGIESAVSQLAAAASDVRDDGTFFSAMSPSAKTQSFDAGESVVWDGTLCDDNPNNPGSTGDGCTEYTLSPDDDYIPRLRWRLSSTSTVPAESGSGTVTRTVTADLRMRPLTMQVRDDDAWSYVYSWKTGDPDGCDMELPNNPNVQSSFYVAGNFCLDNNSSILGPTGSNPPVKVNVRGDAILKKNGNDLGTAARPLTSVHVEGPLGCKFRSNPYEYWCTATEHVVPDSQRGSSAIAVPQASFDDWYYVASPGPTIPCDPALSSGSYPDFTDNDAVASNASLGTLDLATHATFACVTQLGSISWDATAKTLAVDGTIFWDGNLELQDASSILRITYSGAGALYLGGWFRMHQTRVCSVYTSGDCDYDNWDSENNVLLIAANGTNNWSQCSNCSVLMEQSSQFQGALYSDHNMGFQNNSYVQGPMVSQEELIQNSFTFNYLPPLVNVPFGFPSVTIVGWDLTPPENFTG